MSARSLFFESSTLPRRPPKSDESTRSTDSCLGDFTQDVNRLGFVSGALAAHYSTLG
jgi:hypothetical protein